MPMFWRPPSWAPEKRVGAAELAAHQGVAGAGTAGLEHRVGVDGARSADLGGQGGVAAAALLDVEGVVELADLGGGGEVVAGAELERGGRVDFADLGGGSEVVAAVLGDEGGVGGAAAGLADNTDIGAAALLDQGGGVALGESRAREGQGGEAARRVRANMGRSPGGWGRFGVWISSETCVRLRCPRSTHPRSALL